MRFSKRIEIEIAKLLGTVGFRDYGSALWNLAQRGGDAPSPVSSSIDAEIVRQIEDQARHDPAVLSAGDKVVPNLPHVATPLTARAGANAATLFAATGRRTEVLFVIADLASASDYLTKVASALRSAGVTSITTIVTDQMSRPDKVHCLTSDRVVFWKDHFVGLSAENLRFFALAVHALGPAVVIVSGSRIGSRLVTRYGRALAPFHRFFVDLSGIRGSQTIVARGRRLMRLITPYAIPFADCERTVAALADQNSPTVLVAGVLPDAICSVFGSNFNDRRSTRSADLLPAILASKPGEIPRFRSEPHLAPARPKPLFDVTAIIIFHREQVLAGPALASLRDMVTMAKADGLTVEAIALLDRSDDATREIIDAEGAFLDYREEVAFGDLGLTRNHGAAKAKGRFLTFLDGDDLWGNRWIALSYQAASDADAPQVAVWHPEDAFVFSESDFDVTSADEKAHSHAQSHHFMHTPVNAPDFEARDLLIDNLWTANTFAPTDVFLRFPYRSNDWDNLHGIEDWRWNLETLGSGIPHLVVPQTVHLIRKKEQQSLSDASDAKGLLPILT